MAPANLTLALGKVCFTADDGVTAVELWATDGTTAGTALVKDINTGSPAGPSAFPSALTVSNGMLFFGAITQNGCCVETRLWKTDGTAAGR